MWYIVAHQAAHTPPGSLERLLKVTGFVVSIYSCVYRPFAPCRSPAGETFELVAPDKGIRALGEKVSCELLDASDTAATLQDGTWLDSSCCRSTFFAYKIAHSARRGRQPWSQSKQLDKG